MTSGCLKNSREYDLNDVPVEAAVPLGCMPLGGKILFLNHRGAERGSAVIIFWLMLIIPIIFMQFVPCLYNNNLDLAPQPGFQWQPHSRKVAENHPGGEPWNPGR